MIPMLLFELLFLRCGLFFLDQRENRELVRQLAQGKKVLNAFGYTGGFSVAALKGGAQRVVTVDASQKALDVAAVNLKLNGFSVEENPCLWI